MIGSLADRSEAEVVLTAKAIFEWIKTHADQWTFNDAPTWGSVCAEIFVGENFVQLFKMWSDGTLQFMLGNFARTTAYSGQADRTKLLDQISGVTGAQFKPQAIDKSPWFKLAMLNGDRREKLMTLFEEIARRVKV